MPIIIMTGYIIHFEILALLLVVPKLIPIVGFNCNAPEDGEYYYSSFLTNNYTLLSNVFFFITGLLGGYYFKLNPWGLALCLFLIFPLTSLIEGAVYRGSHNLIPFELAYQVVMALPTVAAAYIGRFANTKLEKRKV